MGAGVAGLLAAGGVRVVSVMEGDLLFSVWRQLEKVRGQPVRQRLEIHRSSARNSARGQKAKRAVAINAAWRLATLPGRETPELPAEVMFSDVGVLRDFAMDRKLPEPLDLSASVLATAMKLPQARRTARLQGVTRG